jgi:pimeloyl-ACP methyl ester carboxylesterase
MAGDKDEFCRPEESVRAFRLVSNAHLAIVPDCTHVIPPAVVAIARDFLAIHLPA